MTKSGPVMFHIQWSTPEPTQTKAIAFLDHIWFHRTELRKWPSLGQSCSTFSDPHQNQPAIQGGHCLYGPGPVPQNRFKIMTERGTWLDQIWWSTPELTLYSGRSLPLWTTFGSTKLELGQNQARIKPTIQGQQNKRSDVSYRHECFSVCGF